VDHVDEALLDERVVLIGEDGAPFFEDKDVAFVSEGPIWPNNHIHILRPRHAVIDHGYLSYFLNQLDYSAYINGSTRDKLTQSQLGSIKVAYPALDVQKAIAAFLDRETGRIDQLIRKKERFQEVIDAKRKALTASLVDGSLIRHDNRGIEGWFGRLPTNWKVRRARFLFREHIDPSQEGTEELLTVSHITGVTARAGKDVNMFLAETLEGYKLVQSNDLVVNTMWAWMGAIGVSPIAGCASPSYAVYRPKQGIFRSDYLDLLVRSLPFVAEVNRRSKGIWASRLRLYPDAFLDILFPVPPLDEQEQLVITLKSRMQREEQIAAKSELSIALLKERRRSLIVSAVSGQINVRQLSATTIARSDRSKFRVVVGAEIVQRNQGSQKFGRVKLQKELYLAEVHVGIHELQGRYERRAAGPFDGPMLEETERALEAERYYQKCQPGGAGSAVTYKPLPKAGQHNTELQPLLGSRADALRDLLSLLRDLDKDAVEAVTTLYAVWNDALIDGQQPDDATIINGVLTDWHTEKGEKFRKPLLETWLGWMKRQALIPSGRGPHTVHTMTRDMFA
jgi:type I restriction enzyme S subunit